MNAQLKDWQEIHIAYLVAKLGNLTAAAEVLNVHHATVLRHINSLEKRLDTRLFYRSNKGYTLTEAGIQLLSVAESTQDHFNQLFMRLQGMDKRITGCLTVTTVTSMAPVMTRWLADFQRQYPQVDLNLIANKRILKLEHGEAHIGIRFGSKPTEPDYVVQHVSAMENSLYASPSYLKQYGGMKTLKSIKGHHFISINQYLPYVSFMKWLQETVPEEKIRFQASEFNTMLDAARAGLGISPATCWIADRDTNLVRMLDPPREWKLDMWLVTHRDMHRTSKVQAFLNFFKDTAKKEVY